MSDRLAWLHQRCPECRAAPGQRCSHPYWGRGSRARASEPDAPRPQGLARASVSHVQGDSGRRLLDAAERAAAPWTLLLDEFGAVIKMAAQRGVAILQRGVGTAARSSSSPSPAPTSKRSRRQPGLLASLTDNFTGIVAHRQTSPESRDWLANLMGTRALWQNTQATTGSQHAGPRKRPPRP